MLLKVLRCCSSATRSPPATSACLRVSQSATSSAAAMAAGLLRAVGAAVAVHSYTGRRSLRARPREKNLRDGAVAKSIYNMRRSAYRLES